jgi:xanthine dehydrogenase YagS FAD-binding subunit
LKPFSLARPRALGEALKLMGPDTTAMAGGTDLLGLMKSRIVAPERIVDLTLVDGLDGWERERGKGVRIGALTLLADLESSAELRRILPILPASLADAATPQLRAMGTVGGNLLQRNRCWYYRDDAFKCWLKGGTRCFAREGEHQYHAVVGARECIIASPSDLAPALIALDATVELRSARATREIPVEDLFFVPHGSDRREHAIGPGEVIVSVRVPEGSLARSASFAKQMDRKAWSFALVSVAASARVKSGIARDVRIVLGGVAPVPWRATAAEAALEGHALDEASCARAGALALEGAEPLPQNAYKVPLAGELVRRTLLSLSQ